ncbi:hypothetical protein GCM10007939_12660 [Amylibacter marinus]|uniref:Sulfotransferase family protein n=1 Tax=Amylibacter marinus TaxID=1475483 RepID=A0ABQ5VUT1_9RHOB|nr:sulfotransferase [Amylibacter marinus]GLQ34983.1 hypothetical protein GCM10007939_12660 [Amylibacter marinus]
MSQQVIIAGCTRSGTTVLAQALDRHRDIFIAPEMQYFNQVYGQRRFLSFVPKSRQAKMVARFLSDQEYPARGVFAQAKDQITQSYASAPSIGAAYGQILNSLSDRAVIGEKTPWHSPFALAILRKNPNIKMIVITRHPMPTILSVMNKPGFRRVATQRQCLARWVLINRALRRAVQVLPQRRVMKIRYEDLVQAPEAVLGDICAFLGLDFDPEVLNPRFDEAKEVAQGFVPERAEIWRKSVPEQTSQEVCALAGSLCDWAGYSDIAPRAGLWQRMRLEAEVLLQNCAVLTMRMGLYPFGILTRKGPKHD